MYVKLDELREGVGSLYEFSMANSLNEKILRMCEHGGWSRVRHIVVKIGALRGLDPELLSLAFETVSKGTITEDAILSIMLLPPVYYCRACKRKIEGTDVGQEITECPVCGSRNIEIRNGSELSIEFLEVEKHLPWQWGGAGYDGIDDD